MQVNTFIFPFFCCRFGVYDMRFIYMVIVKEIIFACVIYDATLYHQSQRDIHNFCVTLFSSAWSDSNAYFTY